jgi:peptidoglycan/LPS O-acetylase OafA/YrhL
MREMHNQQKLNALTSLRFFAAAAVVILHSQGNFLPFELPWGWPFSAVGVSFFFVLSGFILFHVYPELPTGRDVVRFWVARAARLWPLHLFALLLLFATVSNRGEEGALPFVANVFLVHAWVPMKDFFFGYNSVSWSISTELGFYLLFPLLLYRFQETWHFKLAAALLLAILLIVLCVLLDLPPYSDTYTGATYFGFMHIDPLARLFEFVLGICAALLWQRIRSRLGSNLVFWTLAELCVIVLFFLYIRYVLLVYPSTAGYAPASHWLSIVGIAPMSALVLIIMADAQGFIGRALSTKPMVFLGEISFSVYMLHQVLLRAYIENAELFSFIPQDMKYPLYWTVLLTLCSAVYHGIETPARRMIVSAADRRTRSIKRQAANHALQLSIDT